MTQKKQTQLAKIHGNITKLLETKAEALPKDFNQTRFVQNAMAVLSETRNIENLQPISVARGLLKGAFLGLDFFMKECYLIPYGNEAQFQTDFKGLCKLAKKYSIKPIKDIYAKLVRHGDTFEEFVQKGEQFINFYPKPFNNGDIIGAFAVIYYEDGSMLYETMTIEQIEHVKESYAKKNKDGQFSPAWRNSPGEMSKKTVLRRLLKMVELEFETEQQYHVYGNDSDFEFKEVEEAEEVKMPEPKKKPEKKTQTKDELFDPIESAKMDKEVL